MDAKVTNDTYVVIAGYDLANGNGYNDHVVGKDGRLHAQGSHDINTQAFPQAEKARWHEAQRTRKHQHHRATRQSRFSGRNVRVAYAQVGPKTWALNALVDRKTGNVIRCDGYTSRKPKHQPQSKLGRLCR